MSVTLSTREIAVLVWSGALLIWALRVPNVRIGLARVVRSACHWKILLPVVVIVGYCSLVVWVLFRVGFWNIYLLKDTLVWVVVSGIALGFSGVDIKKDTLDWRPVIRNQLTAVVVVEYLINTYTFHLLVELILVPIVSLIVLVTSFAKLDQRYALVARLGIYVQAFVGFLVLGFALRGALEQIDMPSVNLAVRSVLLPVVMSTALLPVAQAIALISDYEQLFLLLKFGEKKNPWVIRYAKWKMLRSLGFRRSTVRSFLKNYRRELLWARSRDDIDRVLNQGLRSLAKQNLCSVESSDRMGVSRNSCNEA